MLLTRRQFAMQTAFAAGLAGVPLRAYAEEAAKPGAGSDATWLELRNTHTGESIAANICGADGTFDETYLSGFDRLLRDHRNGAVHVIDRPLFTQLLALPRALGVEARYDIISGYRSPQSNEVLRAAGRGVAQHSLHLEGRAIDIRLSGVNCARLRDAALQAARGGVGYYAKSNFVHVDTGRVRAWAG